MHDFSAEHNAPVDLAYLREITDGEKALEKELFAIFIRNADNYLRSLADCCSDGENLEWRRLSHEFKGSSESIGANKLAGICQQSQSLFQAPANEKKAILTPVSNELEVVKNFLGSIY